LTNAAKEAKIIGLPVDGLAVKIDSIIILIKTIESKINTLLEQINTVMESETFPNSIRDNIELIDSLPGAGRLTAITLIAEIGDINDSGNFKGNNNKISKRGTRIGRRALYAVALASIRSNRNGIPINKVLLEYYQANMKGKKPQIALVAIIHKIINYFFAVLRNQTRLSKEILRYINKCFRKPLFKQGRLIIFRFL